MFLPVVVGSVFPFLVEVIVVGLSCILYMSYMLLFQCFHLYSFSNEEAGGPCIFLCVYFSGVAFWFQTPVKRSLIIRSPCWDFVNDIKHFVKLQILYSLDMPFNWNFPCVGSSHLNDITFEIHDEGHYFFHLGSKLHYQYSYFLI